MFYFVWFISAQNIDCGYNASTEWVAIYNLCYWAEIKELIYIPFHEGTCRIDYVIKDPYPESYSDKDRVCQDNVPEYPSLLLLESSHVYVISEKNISKIKSYPCNTWWFK